VTNGPTFTESGTWGFIMVITYTDIGMIIVGLIVIAIGILIGMGGKARVIQDESEYDVDYDPAYDHHSGTSRRYHHASNHQQHGSQAS